MIYYAKSNPIETIDEHVGRMLELCDKLETLYPELFDRHGWDMLRYAIEIHDFGKSYIDFQHVIRKAIAKRDPAFISDISLPERVPEKSIPHNCLSPAVINEDELKSRGWTDKDITLVAVAVYFHHEKRSVAQSIERNATPFKAEIKAALEGEYGDHVRDFSGCKPARLYCGSIQKEFRRGTREYDDLAVSREYIMLHGWLNRIDYAASAHLEDVEIPALDAKGQTYSDLTEASLARYKSLRAVQEFARANSGRNLAFVAATGSGKTEAALLWGGGRKLFYTLPVKTAINAMFKRLYNGLGYRKAALLHSDALSVYNDAAVREDDGGREDAVSAFNAARQLCAPLTVCTVDQLFTFVFRGTGSECKLATLSHACIVIDEIQSYSPDIIAALLYGVDMLISYGGRVLIMTATLPKIIVDKDILPLLRKKNGKDFVIPHFYTELDHRHRAELRLNAKWDDEACLNEILEKGNQMRVLVTVNTVRKAQELYDLLKARNPRYLKMLHSRYMRKDRNRLESEILEFAPNDSSRSPKFGIWICTQVVEASLDVDFDILYTDMCAIESLLQRMGRVYRGRNLDTDDVNIVVLDTKNGISIGGIPGVISQYMYEFSLEALKKITRGGSVLLVESKERDIKTELMDLVYDPALNPDIERKYYDEIKRRKNTLADAFSRPHSSEVNKFRDIITYTVMPYSEYFSLEESGEFDKWKSALASADTSWDKKQIFDEIYSHTVNLPYLKMNQIIRNDRTRLCGIADDIYVFCCEYDPERGLLVKNDGKNEIEAEFRFL